MSSFGTRPPFGYDVTGKSLQPHNARRPPGYPSAIGCLAILLALISPRLALFFVWLFSDLLGRAFDSWVVPLLGFFLLPWTTLAYALMWSSSNGVVGFEWFIVVLAFLFDLAAYDRGARRRYREV